MPARIEFIPYGNKWDPRRLIIPDGEQDIYYRRPDYKRLQFVTPMIISALHADVTIVDHILPGESMPRRTHLRSGGPTLVIHRAAISSHPDTARGTMRISHADSEESDDGAGDREPRRVPDLDPEIAARLVLATALGDEERSEITN